MNTTTTTSTPSTARADAIAPAPRTLDELAALDVDALRALYAAGRVTPLSALDGTPRCRMLAIRGLDRGPGAEGIRRFAAARFFPWAGKQFSPVGGTDTGTGINRVRLAGERRWFPFATRVEPSVLDGKPCILLDYDLSANPKPIRMIRDELREISPGLYLGPAMLETKGKAATLILFFACHFTADN